MEHAKKARFDIYPTDELLDALDRWRGVQPGIPSRAEAARRLLEKALVTEGVIKPGRRAKA